MYQTAIEIVLNVLFKLTDNSDVSWTKYNSTKEFREEIKQLVSELKRGNDDALYEINHLFLPTASFQEHALHNNRHEKYLVLAEEFDKLYNKHISNKNK